MKTKQLWLTASSVLVGLVLIVAHLPARAQSRVDLDDVNINGETQSDGRLTLRSRQMGQLKSGLKARTSLRERILESLPADGERTAAKTHSEK